MKKILTLTLLLLNLNFALFSVDCILTDDIKYENIELKKGQVLDGVSDRIQDCTVGENSIPYNLRSESRYPNVPRGIFINTDLLIPKDTIDIFDFNITFSGLFAKNKILVHENQIKILKQSDTYMEALENYYPDLYYYYNIDPYQNDIDILYRNYITNAILNLRAPDIDYNISILNITKQDNNKYIIDCDAGHFVKGKTYLDNRTTFTITLTIDGDYFIFSSDRFDTEKFVVVDIEAEDLYYKVMNGESVDLSNFNWPKHADGSCTITEKPKSDVIELPVQEEPKILVEQYSQDPELKEYYLYKTKREIDLYHIPTLEKNDLAKKIEKGTIVKLIEIYNDFTFDGIPSRWLFISTELEKSYFSTVLDSDIKFFCAACDLELIEDQGEPIEIQELAEKERLEKQKKIRITLLISISSAILIAALILLLKKKRKH